VKSVKSSLSVSALRNSLSSPTSENGSPGGGEDEAETRAENEGTDGQNGEDAADEDNDDGETEQAVYLRYDPVEGLDAEKYAVLPNDWPYNVPYGVRHYCVWSRVSRLSCVSHFSSSSSSSSSVLSHTGRMFDLMVFPVSMHSPLSLSITT